jgi:hypothetical protein
VTDAGTLRRPRPGPHGRSRACHADEVGHAVPSGLSGAVSDGDDQAELRMAIAKEAGDTVTIVLEERLEA